MKACISRVTVTSCLILVLISLFSCEDAGEKECECVCDCGDEDDDDGADDDAGLDDDLDRSICDSASGGFSNVFTNPYAAFDEGNQWILEGMENFEQVRERITVLSRTEVISGVTALAVESRKWVANELTEVSYRYFAQASDETVCYFGKDVDKYNYGSVIGHEGAWKAGEGGASSGIYIPGSPEVGMTFRHFNAPGVGLEDAEITDMDGSYSTPAGSFNEVMTLSVTTLSGGKLTRKYAYGEGMIVDQAKELTE